ncbi:hypothetical protein OS493_035835 [Desmophyllum pertusum]|uniref:Uncharacterized protein n=1 Tax=Desmophyllum pertusum TaxID=174260 RepID=A0A9X0CCR4_9CNID|nr:hypothetical protein OS493_035835 [Desmophyllum pertusum]
MNWCVGMLLCSYVIFSCALGNPTTPSKSVEAEEISRAVDDPKLSVFKNALWKRTVVCDTSHYCPNGNTCCRLVSGSGAVVQFQMLFVAVMEHIAVHKDTPAKSILENV